LENLFRKLIIREHDTVVKGINNGERVEVMGSNYGVDPQILKLFILQWQIEQAKF
jgi:hypothetical protein